MTLPFFECTHLALHRWPRARVCDAGGQGGRLRSQLPVVPQHEAGQPQVWTKHLWQVHGDQLHSHPEGSGGSTAQRHRQVREEGTGGTEREAHPGDQVRDIHMSETAC